MEQSNVETTTTETQVTEQPVVNENQVEKTVEKPLDKNQLLREMSKESGAARRIPETHLAQKVDDTEEDFLRLGVRDLDAVGAVGGADGAHRPRISNRCSDFGIGGDLT